jgi:uncharacterized protein (DUF2141 family)
MRRIRTLALFLLGFLILRPALAAELVLEVIGPQPSGRVNVALYEGAANFLRKPLATGSTRLIDGVANLKFQNLEPGTYAISAYLDTNDNNRLDTNSMGIPIEPYALSRGAKGRMGPSSFEDAAFELEPSGAKLRLELRK